MLLRVVESPHLNLGSTLQTTTAPVPDLLTVEDVQARYHLRDPRAARRIVRQVGALAVAGRLFVRRDAFERWEASQGLAPTSPPRRAPHGTRRHASGATHDLSALAPGWWCEGR